MLLALQVLKTKWSFNSSAMPCTTLNLCNKATWTRARRRISCESAGHIKPSRPRIQITMIMPEHRVWALTQEINRSKPQRASRSRFSTEIKSGPNKETKTNWAHTQSHHPIIINLVLTIQGDKLARKTYLRRIVLICHTWKTGQTRRKMKSQEDME